MTTIQLRPVTINPEDEITEVESKETFEQLLWRSGFTDVSRKGKERIAAYLKVSVRTIERWIKHNNPTEMAKELLAVKRTNLRQSTTWDGFIFREDYLVTPDGSRLTGQDLRMYGFFIQFVFTVCDEVEYESNETVMEIRNKIIALASGEI